MQEQEQYHQVIQHKMAELDIESAVSSDLKSAFTDYSVPTETTDAASASGETIWYNDKWSQYFGYYKKIPELRAVIDAAATWTIGKGFNSDDVTTLLLDTIKGIGIDSFNTIIENTIRTYYIGGDAFIHIIRDEYGD